MQHDWISMGQPPRRTAVSRLGSRLVMLSLLCAGLAACGLHWPWRHRTPPSPQPVQDLSIQPTAEGGAAAPIQQFWDRNTLLLDLTALNGEGEAALVPNPARGWPVRLEFRVQPGSMTRLEIQGHDRVVFEVPAQGAPLVLKLSPSAYLHDTPQIIVRWSEAGDSAH